MKQIITLATIVGIAFSVFFFLDGRYALSGEVMKLEQRVKVNELRDLERKAMEDVYFYRQQQRKYPADRQVVDKMDEAETELNKLRKQLEEVEK